LLIPNEESQLEYISNDEEDCGEEDSPLIKLFVEEKKSIREPCRQTIIVKVIGEEIRLCIFVAYCSNNYWNSSKIQQSK
jgi:hypothetical protein